jgi:FAD:protein FMN transferase
MMDDIWVRKIRLLFLSAFAILVIGFSGCGRDDRRATTIFHGKTMGTSYTVKLGQVSESVDLDELDAEILQRLEQVNRLMSTYQKESELSRFNASESTDWFPISVETAEVVREAIRINRMTGGAFDPTVGPLVRLWNFGPGRKSVDMKPTDSAISQQLKQLGMEKIELRDSPVAIRKTAPGVELDLSGIAKGYAVDRVAELIERAGCENYMVEVGGEVRSAGVNAENKLWRIAIEKPTVDSRSVFAVVELDGRAMATSGDYRNYFEQDGVRYSHLIDPRTGRPIRHKLASVSVFASTSAEADALATGLIVLGPDAAMELAKRENISVRLLVREGRGFVEMASGPVSDASQREVK